MTAILLPVMNHSAGKNFYEPHATRAEIPEKLVMILVTFSFTAVFKVTYHFI